MPDATFTEDAWAFGADEALIGVSSQPVRPPSRTGALVLNAGFAHRVGPFRLNVDIARRLASEGFPALRFDLTGLGDSVAHGVPLPYEEQVARDVGQAADVVTERWGAEQLVAMGLCSGAVNAHLAAVHDDRIRGVVQLDGFAYPTRQYVLRHYGERVTDLRRVARFVGRRTRRWLGDEPVEHETGAAAGSSSEGFYLEEWRRWRDTVGFPPRDRAADELRRLVERGVRMLFIYSGEVRGYVNYRDQLADAFADVDFRGLVDVEMWHRTDHVFVLADDRQRLLRRLAQWMRTHFG